MRDNIRLFKVSSSTVKDDTYNAVNYLLNIINDNYVRSVATQPNMQNVCICDCDECEDDCYDDHLDDFIYHDDETCCECFGNGLKSDDDECIEQDYERYDEVEYDLNRLVYNVDEMSELINILQCSLSNVEELLNALNEHFKSANKKI